MVNSLTANTSFPYALYTSGAATLGGTIKAQAYGMVSASLKCFNDGWIWHRGR
jgi:hypothetical protein